jgi:multidrug resistance efflux pump
MRKKYMILFCALVLVSSCTKEQADYIKVAGIVDGDIFTVKAAVAGKIEVMNIKEGLPVKKDDILIEVNSEKLLNQLEGLSIRKKEINVNRKKINNQIIQP